MILLSRGFFNDAAKRRNGGRGGVRVTVSPGFVGVVTIRYGLDEEWFSFIREGETDMEAREFVTNYVRAVLTLEDVE